MEPINKNILHILSNSVFQKIINNESIKIEQLNAATTLLIKLNIPFVLIFNQSTRNSFKFAELAISINPSTNIEFTISFNESI